MNQDNLEFKCVKTLSDIRNYTITPDGTRLICNRNSSIEILDLLSGEVLHTLNKNHSKFVISDDSQRFVSMNYETGTLWDIKSGEILHDRVYLDDASSLSQDGIYLFRCRDRLGMFFDLSHDRKLIRHFSTEYSPIKLSAISPDIKNVVMLLENNSLELWSLEEGASSGRIWLDRNKQLFKQITINASVSNIAFSPNGLYLLISARSSHYLWDMKTFDLLSIDIRCSIENVSFIGDEKLFLGRKDGVTIIDCKSGNTICNFPLECDEIRITYDKSRFITRSFKHKEIKIWDIEKQECIQTIALEDYPTDQSILMISPDGKHIVSRRGSDINYWSLVERETFKFEGMSELDYDCVYTLKLDGKQRHLLTHLLLSKSDYYVYPGAHDIIVGDLKSGKILHHLDRDTLDDGSVQLATIASDSKRIVFTDNKRHKYNQNYIMIWDYESDTGCRAVEIRENVEEFFSIAVSPDGESIIIGLKDGTIVILESKRNYLRRDTDIKIVADHPLTLAISPNGSYITAVSENRIKIWEFESLKCIQKLDYEANFDRLVISPNEKYILSVRMDNKYHDRYNDMIIKIWELKSGCLINTIINDASSYKELVTFSSDSNHIFVVTRDDVLQTWDIGSAQCIQSLKIHLTSKNKAISPDGDYIVSHHNKFREENGMLKIWKKKDLE